MNKNEQEIDAMWAEEQFMLAHASDVLERGEGYEEALSVAEARDTVASQSLMRDVFD